MSIKLLEGGKVKEIFELKGQGRSIRGIADDLGICKNTVKMYLRCPGLPKPKLRPHRPSLLDPFKERLQARLAEGVFNCEVLEREILALGYPGGKTILRTTSNPFGRRDSPRRRCGLRRTRESTPGWTSAASSTRPPAECGA